MSWTVIRTLSPSLITDPSTTPFTPRARAISGSGFIAFLYCITDVREITLSARIRDSSAINASVIPSAKYSCAGSFERFERGRTARESIRLPASSAPEPSAPPESRKGDDADDEKVPP